MRTQVFYKLSHFHINFASNFFFVGNKQTNHFIENEY